MVECPRCGDTVETLRSLPAGAIEKRLLQRDEERRDDHAGKVCSWCRHEVIEG